MPTRPRSVSFFAWFSRHIFRTQSFQEKRHVYFHVLVALKLLVLLDDHRIACIQCHSIDARESWLFSLSSRHISRTQSFQEKRPIKSKISQPLKRFMAVIGRPVPCTARLVSRRTDKQTDRPSTVTLAAHVHRGLIRSIRHRRPLKCIEMP